MRFSILPVLALTGTFTSVLSAPTPEPLAIERRATTQAAVIQSLITTVVPSLSAINATAHTVTPASAPAALALAEAAAKTEITAVVSAFSASTAQLKALKGKRDTTEIATRQATVPLGVLLGELVADVLAAVDALLNSLGLGPASGLLAPLGPALSALLLALEVVVDDLLLAVETLVNDLLTGLAAGLILAK
ncbi:hypothetical protein MMC34_006865 [Xylographa carneopallida]|nr:hypothetical protein [Xylographa carneopallida]